VVVLVVVVVVVWWWPGATAANRRRHVPWRQKWTLRRRAAAGAGLHLRRRSNAAVAPGHREDDVLPAAFGDIGDIVKTVEKVK